ncbi:glycosyltransferase family 1 [Colletotrichum higginsianum]|uniref:Glycosyltransferase family 1 n=2 Tax=Colletotrichum higginsianum TaxID=80884 RepID=H1VNJ2_COLHI|nr:Glycosyltransferase family 1 [Colletotrichum higginsianum IMI 349063]OBR12939.1 Glycosyltransferase family 1 [Colletotrichum higginsianum IMI 349063]TIC99168.1 GDP-mannose-dependent alpha-mannosyltransferase [Colletotrichum higginsianum]CCF41796.1 glycosyltransferase family 1 [Colletotrichum higginsianum]
MDEPLLPMSYGTLPRYPARDNSVFPCSLRGKRILLCTESFGPVNGVSRTTLMLVEHLRSHGALVAVVAPHIHTQHNTFAPSSSSSSSSSAGGHSDSHIEVRLQGYPLPFNPELSVVYPVRVSALFARTFGADTPPDLIYLASPASLGFQVMLQLQQQPRARRVPVICNFQTDLAGYCAILFPHPFSTVAVFAFAMVQSFLFRHDSVKTVFYPSRFVRKYLEAQGVQGSKLEVLRRGVKTEVFRPEMRSPALRKLIAPDGEIILLCVSRVAGEKGFDFLAKAVKELDARGLRFKLYVVGGNRNPDVESQVHAMFDPLRAQGKVIFAGFKTGEDLATAYASGDIFLHCSVTETFGLVVLESMASGVPVVARDEGGPSDIIDDGHCGYLVPPDDLETFVDKVMYLSKDHSCRERMAVRAREMACEATWEKINNQVAWRMADTIEERERENAQLVHQRTSIAMQTSQTVPIHRWLLMGDAIRDVVVGRLVDAKLAGGLGVVMTFWFFTGLYLAFTETVLWFKGKLPRLWSQRTVA